MPLSLGSLRIVRTVNTTTPCRHCGTKFPPGEVTAILFGRSQTRRFSTRLHLECAPKFMYLKYLDYTSHRSSHRHSTLKKRESTLELRARKSKLNRFNYLHRLIAEETNDEQITLYGRELINLALELNRNVAKAVKQDKARVLLVRAKLVGVGLLPRFEEDE